MLDPVEECSLFLVELLDFHLHLSELDLQVLDQDLSCDLVSFLFLVFNLDFRLQAQDCTLVLQLQLRNSMLALALVGLQLLFHV